MKVQVESFHLNGHIIGFRPQTQKLELPHKSPICNASTQESTYFNIKKVQYQGSLRADDN